MSKPTHRVKTQMYRTVHDLEELLDLMFPEDYDRDGRWILFTDPEEIIKEIHPDYDAE